MALRLRPEAREDLDAAARWYEGQENGLGRQFLAEVRLVFQRIRANPDAYPVTYRGTRRALISNTSKIETLLVPKDLRRKLGR